ncbi:MAG: dUTP diphosphatase [Myxococcales bacterium]|nr:dUTP diphosphatase [Myxococcales bacterium]
MEVIPLIVLPHGDGLALPARATAGAAGFDLRAAVTDPITVAPGKRALIPTGVALAIPEGWEGQVRPRSGLALTHGITLINAPGTIDSDYRGEILVALVNLGEEPFVVTRGQRIAQLVFQQLPYVEVARAARLPPASGGRGGGGFGSTGKQ